MENNKQYSTTTNNPKETLLQLSKDYRASLGWGLLLNSAIKT